MQPLSNILLYIVSLYGVVTLGACLDNLDTMTLICIEKKL